MRRLEVSAGEDGDARLPADARQRGELAVQGFNLNNCRAQEAWVFAQFVQRSGAVGGGVAKFAVKFVLEDIKREQRFLNAVGKYERLARAPGCDPCGGIG